MIPVTIERKHNAITICLVVGAVKSRAFIHELANRDQVIATLEGPHRWVIAGLNAILDHYVATPETNA